MKQYWPLIIIITLFLLLKLSSLGIRMSDTNIYFYTAYQMLQGKVLYKDIFFTNFPLLPYVSVCYYFFFGKSLTAYFFTSCLEASAVAGILYYLAINKTKSLLIATLTAMVYLFSFIVLSTSDHQTGVFLASLFALLSYFFFEKKHYVLTGCFVALALLTKAYFLPILASYGVFLLIRQRKTFLPFCLGLIVTSGIILLPILIFARNDFFKDVFLYSLTRSQGLSKTNILWFFATHDILFFVMFMTALTQIKKQLFFALFCFFSLAFIIFYQDIYFLYLNFTIPFLCLFFAFFYHDSLTKLQIQKMVIPSLIVLLLVYNLFTYLTGFRNIQTFTQLDTMVTKIKEINPPALYGTNDTTPALSYLTGIPLLNGIVDTNENIFRKGYLNNKTLTKDALSQHALFVGHGVYYPEENLNQPLINEIFDLTQMQGKCKIEGSYPIVSEGMTNRITLVACGRN
ncbi:hypothetical protein BH11PAT1_BH11PAT1_0570 [soil metagenome]